MLILGKQLCLNCTDFVSNASIFSLRSQDVQVTPILFSKPKH